jgi:hypothetical protein
MSGSVAVRAMLVEVNCMVIALKRQQEVLRDLVDSVEKAEGLGCEVSVETEVIGQTRRVRLDVLMSAPVPVPVARSVPMGRGFEVALAEADKLDATPPLDPALRREAVADIAPVAVAEVAPEVVADVAPEVVTTIVVDLLDEGPKFRIEAAPELGPKPVAEVVPRVATSAVPFAALWTDIEDATAVAMKAKGHTAREIAELLGRPVPGTQYRLKTMLKERVAQAQTGAATPAAAKAEVAPPREDDNAPAPAPATTTTLEDHIAGLRRSGSFWTLERDEDLMRLADLGWDPDTLAQEMECAALDITTRFKVLTDNKRFPRAAVAKYLAEITADAVPVVASGAR